MEYTSIIKYDTGCGGTVEYVYGFSSIDDCGNNSALTIASFILEDTTVPSITTAASDEIADCDGSGNTAQLTVWLTNNGGAVATDLCGNITWSYDLISESDLCTFTGAGMYRFIATDDCGNVSVSDASFIINDTTDPVIVAPAVNITVECNGSNNSADLLAWLNNNGGAAATDECSNINWTNDYGMIGAGACDGDGSVTVVFTATDDCGNATTTAATLTIDDSTVPTWVINPTALTLECSDLDDPMSAIAAWLSAAGNGTATDECSVITYTNDFVGLTGGCSGTNTGTASVNFVATDACGNSAQQTAVVTVLDNTNPAIDAPAVDQTTECDGAGNTTGLNAWLTSNAGALSSDLCGMITWNTPVLLNTITGCGGTTEFIYSFSSTDECGNISATTVASYIIEDTTAPNFSVVASNLTSACDGTGNVSQLNDWLSDNGGAMATDICGVVSWSFDLIAESDQCSFTGAGTYRFIATDECGNTSFSDASFIINDIVDPVMIVEASNLLVECDGSNNTSELLNWLNENGGAAATDECSSISWTNNYGAIGAGACDGDGAVTVIFTATDDCGNETTTSATLTINDTNAPEWTIAPTDLVLECTDDMDPMDAIQAWLAAVGNADAEDECSLIAYTNNFVGLSGACSATSNTGTATVTFTATDACGNAVTAEATVTVEDNTAPNIDSPAQNTVVECDGSGNTAALNAWLLTDASAQSSDFCGTVVWNTPILLNTISGCGGVIEYVYSFSSTDECGNISAATTASFKIEDTTGPSINTTASDMISDCDGTGNVAQLNVWLLNSGGAAATDLCGNVSWTYDLITESDLCSFTGAGVYRFTAEDECGNTSTTEASFIINDITDPVLVGPAVNLTIECDGANNSAELLDWLNNNGGATATDECSTLVWSNNYGTIGAGACEGSGSVTVIFTATDECGNSVSTTATLTINDQVSPTWVLPPTSLVLECTDDVDPMDAISAWLISAGNGIAADECSVISYTNDFVGLTNSCAALSNTGTALVTFVATDACGNSQVATANVTVEDNAAPVIDSPAFDQTVECNGSGNTAELSNWLNANGSAMVSDLCGSTTWNAPVLVNTITGCGGSIEYVYSFNASDDCGNVSANTIASFTIEDTTIPSINTAASDMTADCDGTGNDAQLMAWIGNNGGAMATDVCGTLEWTYELVSESDLCTFTGAGLYRFTAVDACGNSNTTEASFIINDITDPVIVTDAADLIVECDGSNNVAELINWLNDNGGAGATDECSNITWSNDYGIVGAGACDGSGSVTVVFTATDDCGNQNTTSATLTINDNTEPVWVIAPTDLVIECSDDIDPYDAINAWLLAAGNGDAQDECSVITYTNDFTVLAANCGPTSTAGTATVTFRATDACGNFEELAATVTVVDNVAPVIDLPAQNMSVECDGGGNNTQLAAWLAANGNAMASDLCGTITWDPPTLLNTIPGCGDSFEYVYSWTATDACGNVSPATIASFFILDDTDPTVTLEAMDLTVDCDGLGNTVELNDWLLIHGGADADDVCGTIEWTYELVADSDICINLGAGLYRFTATDQCGNASITEASFIIIDDTDPIITTEAQDLDVQCDGSNNTPELLDWLNSNGGAGATDECSDITWSNDYGSLVPGVCDGIGEVLVIFTASDACGNATTTSATLTINDDEDPIWTIEPADLVLECTDDVDPMDAVANWLAAVGYSDAFDDCSVITYTNNFTQLINGCSVSSNTGMATVTFTATDACGNFVTAEAIVTVEDNAPPTIDAPAVDATVECDGAGNIVAVSDWLADNGGAISSDFCGDVTWNTPVLMNTINGCGGTVEFVYSFSSTDDCGNVSATTVASFIIEDTSNPTITTPAVDEIADCDGLGNTIQLNSWLTNNGGASAADICGPVTWMYELVSESDLCTFTGAGLYRFTATDECGNLATTEASFIINDITAPVIVTDAVDISIECDGTNNVAELLDWLNNNGEAEATDECSNLTWSNDYGTLADGACDGSGSVTVVFTATDDCGNTSTTSATLTITDDTDPIWTLEPTDLVLECTDDVDPMNAVMAWLDAAGLSEAEDECSVIAYSNDFTGLINGCSASSNTGSAIVTFVATDACGNSVSSIATVTVEDNASPSIDAPALDEAVECDGLGNTAELNAWLAIQGGALSSDFCGDITWNTPVLLNTIDGCGGTTQLVYSFSSTDECGNVSAITVASFVINDTTDPMITAPADDMIADCNGAGNQVELTTWLGLNGGATATDICGAVSWTYDLISESDLCTFTGAGLYRFTATDECGNESTTDASFIINDITAPLITTEAGDLMIQCDGSNNVDILLDWLNNNGGGAATDECSILEWSNDYGTLAAGACDGTGSVTVVFTATDQCGNATTTEATLTINDDEAPEWTIEPTDLTLECTDDIDPMDAIMAWLDAAGNGDASDECSVVTYTNDFVALVDGCPGNSNTGTAVVTYVATDACGNSVTAIANVLVEDNFAPTIDSPALDSVVECDGLGNVGSLQAWLDDNAGAESSDYCGDVTWNTPVLLSTIPGCGSTVTYIYAFSTTDACGNVSANTVASFSIVDTTPPMITTEAADMIADCNSVGNLVELNTWLADNGGGVATDLCGDVSWEYDLVSESDLCTFTGAGLYRFTATDECGNSSTTEASFTINDITAPVITAEAGDLEVQCDGNDNVVQLLDWLNDNGGATATDECSDLTWSNDYGTLDAGACDGSGSFTVVFTVTDACGNTSTSDATLTINDDTEPVWTLEPTDLVLECTDDVDPMNAVMAWLDAAGFSEAEDECSVIRYTNDFTGLIDGCAGVSNTGTALVTFVATDACGNSITAVANVTVEDNTSPEIDTPAQNFTVECNGLGNNIELTAWLDNHGGAESSDYCGEITWNAPVLVNTINRCEGTVEYAYSFTTTDACGNISASTIARFIIEDTTAPTLDTEAEDMIVDCNGLGNGPQLLSWLDSNGGATASDLCGTITWEYDLVSESDLCTYSGTGLYRFTAIDDCGNASTTEASFIINDIISPDITVEAGDLTVECDGASNVAELLSWLNNNGGAEAIDECSSVTWSNNYGEIVGACETTGAVEVTFTVTDQCGNTSTSAATLVINDNTAPTWVLPPTNLVLECTEGTDPLDAIDAWLLASGNGVANDECSIITYVNDFVALEEGCSPTSTTGSALVTFYASDACGNMTTATAMVTVIDNAAPSIDFPAQNMIVECDGEGNAAELADWLADNGGAVSTDVCGDILWNTPTLVNINDNCGETGEYVYSFTSRDECGNVSLASTASFVIRDRTDPIILTEAEDLIINCDDGSYVAIMDEWIATNGGATAIDQCGELTWSYDLVADSDFCAMTGTGTYRFTVVDECGNSAFSEAELNIIDVTAPVIDGGSDMNMAECVPTQPAGNYPEFDYWLTSNAGASATDECSGYTWSNDYTPDNWVDGCGNSRSVDVTFTVTDICGNAASIMHSFMVGDMTPPEFLNCPRPAIVVASPDTWCEAFVNFSPVSATDNCSNVTITQIDGSGLNSGSLFPVGVTVLTYQAMDECGNSSTCSIKVIVNDFHSIPTITCPKDITISGDAGLCGGIALDSDSETNTLAPFATDNCPDNMAVLYEIMDETGATVSCGIENIAGAEIPHGVNTVTYTAQDQPVFLITEVVQSEIDQLELTNFGPASLDISCLKIERVGAGAEIKDVPVGTILGVGDTYVVDWAADIAVTDAAAYTISLNGSVLDAVVVNGFVWVDGWTGILLTGDAERQYICDHDSELDWIATSGCNHNIGLANEELPVFADNGATTGIQSVKPSKASCDFLVTVIDNLAPNLAGQKHLGVFGDPTTTTVNHCITSIITIPDDVRIAAINLLNIDLDYTNGSSVNGKLVSPDGTVMSLFAGLCDVGGLNFNLMNGSDEETLSMSNCASYVEGGDFASRELLSRVAGEFSSGEWKLELSYAEPGVVTLNDWEIEVYELTPFDLADVKIDNDPDSDPEFCGANYRLRHPSIDDFCTGGTLSVEYTKADGTIAREFTLVEEGALVTEFFPLGTNVICYYVVDAAGNSQNFCYNLIVEDPLGLCIPPCPTDCELTCLSQINISLDESCEIMMVPSMASPLISSDCNDYYSIEITDASGNILTSNMLTAEYIGGDLTFMITEPVCGNTCWGTITVEDKFAPVFTNCDEGPFNVPCNGLDMIPPPVPTENCSDFTVFLIDEVEEFFECEEITGRVTRSWAARDAAGNVSPFPCVQVINIVRPDLSMITVPPTATYSCNEEYPKDENGNPAPWVPAETGSGSGVPILCTPGFGQGVDCITGEGSGDGIFLIPGETDVVCNTFVSYTDTPLPSIGCTQKIMRRFEVREWWCGGEMTWSESQLIEITDDQGPEFTCPVDMIVTTDSGCNADIMLPSVLAEDVCGTETSIKIEVSGNGNGFPGALVESNGGVVTLPVGDNIVTYIAYDECNNSTSCTITVRVEDMTQPVAICEQFTVLSLPSDGNIEIWGESFDDGSWDECGIDRFEVRRMSSECDQDDVDYFDDSVAFCCADIGKENMVLLRVYDISGNYNECMVNVEIQDKTEPSITCPSDRTISCVEPYDLNNLSLAFDAASANDNCDTDSIVETYTTDITSCGTGSITRVFTIYDGTDVIAECSQEITILQDQPMTESDIIWPSEVEIFDGCDIADVHPDNLPVGQAYPIVTEGVCDLVGFSFEDEVFANIPGSDACVKVLRTWKVLNWCQTNPSGEFIVWEWVQVLIINNTIDPIISGDCSDISISSIDVDCDEVPVSLTMTATDDCTPTAQLNWSWTIDIFKDGITSNDINGVGPDASDDYPIGTHEITWTVEDQCGNIDFCSQEIEIINDKAPNAVCIYGLSSELIPVDTDGNGSADTEMVTLWAIDFDGGSFHPCGYDVEISFSADPDDLFVSFGCGDVGMQSVELWATDTNGNTSKCVTFINITNSVDADLCSDTPDVVDVEGRILTGNQQEVKDVFVNLNGSNLSDMTDDSGEYAFENMPMGGAYKVVPTKNDDLLNGVTTLDLIFIQRHILGLDNLDNAYQYLAADANKSGNISGVDLVAIRKAILGVSNEFPNNESWRFIDAEFNFASDTDPLDEQFNEDYNIPTLSSDMKIDFVGVKVGDVNGSVVLNGLTEGNFVESRSSEKLLLEGKVIGQTLNIKSSQQIAVAGMQMTIEFDPSAMAVYSIESQVLDLQDEYYHIDNEQGVITLSWNVDKDITLDRGANLFALNVSKNASSSMIDISSKVTKAEAYNSDLNVMDIKYQSDEDISSIFLAQNEPNPWTDKTTIAFEINKAQEVTFYFRDGKGAVIHKVVTNAEAGSNSIDVQKTDLNTSGVIFYEMQTADERITKKMILLR